jgi:hypothetical protein
MGANPPLAYLPRMGRWTGLSKHLLGCLCRMKRLVANLGGRKRCAIWVAAGCALAALIAMLAFPREREPEYGGRYLTEWIRLYLQSPDRFTDGQEAAEAVRHIGTNALPLLLKWTDYEPPGWKTMLATNAPAAARRPGYFRSAYVRLLNRPADDLNWLARFGFEILGPQARPALPEIQRRMVDWGKPWRAGIAMQIYTDIEGPGGVPALVSALVSTNANCRQSAAFCLATLGTNGAPAAPMLRNALNDPDTVVRRLAATALQRILPQTRRQP